MAIMYPTEIREIHGEVSPAERKIFELLRDELRDGIHVVWSFLWQDNRRAQGEADFVIIHDRFPGFLVLEVKGGAVELRDNQWHQRIDEHNWKPIDPVNQAMRSMWEIKRRTEGQFNDDGARWKVRGHVGLVFPDVTLPAPEDGYGGVEAAEIVDHPKLRSLADAIDRFFGRNRRPPDCAPKETEVDALLEVVRPTREFAITLESRIGGERQAWKRLTEGQLRVIDFLETAMPRAAFAGVAGSGKTLLAMEAARRFADSRGKALYLCYNRPLGVEVYLQARADNVSAFPVDALLVSLEKQYGALADFPPERRWNAIFVDEAQDFGEELWEKIKALAEDWNDATVWLFYDYQQNIRNRNRQTIVDRALKDNWVPLRPQAKNIRNTISIGTFASGIVDEQAMEFPEGLPRGEDVEVKRVSSRGEVVEFVLRRVWSWIQAGVEEGRIAVLYVPSGTTGATDAIQENLCAGSGPIPLLVHLAAAKKNAGNAIRMRMRDNPKPQFSTVERFKGLEADAVLLVTPVDPCTCDFHDEPAVGVAQARHRMFVGATRAQHLLAVLQVPVDWSLLCRAFWRYYGSAYKEDALKKPMDDRQAWREVRVCCGGVAVCVSLGLEPDGVHVFIRGEIDGAASQAGAWIAHHSVDLAELTGATEGTGSRSFYVAERYDMQLYDQWAEAASWMHEQRRTYVEAVALCCESTATQEQERTDENEERRETVRRAVAGLKWSTYEEIDRLRQQMLGRGEDREILTQEIEELGPRQPEPSNQVKARERMRQRFQGLVRSRRRQQAKDFEITCRTKAGEVRRDGRLTGDEARIEVRRRVCEALGVAALAYGRNVVFMRVFGEVFSGIEGEIDHAAHT